MAFIAVGDYIINTVRLTSIVKNWGESGDVKVYLDGSLYSFSASQEDAKDLLEWVEEATAKCKYCGRFDCNCGATGRKLGASND